MIKLYLLNWRINLFCFVHIPIIFGNLPAAVLVYLFVNGQDSIVTFVLNLTINFDSAKALLTLPNSLSSLSNCKGGILYIRVSPILGLAKTPRSDLSPIRSLGSSPILPPISIFTKIFLSPESPLGNFLWGDHTRVYNTMAHV